MLVWALLSAGSWQGAVKCFWVPGTHRVRGPGNGGLQHRAQAPWLSPYCPLQRQSCVLESQVLEHAQLPWGWPQGWPRAAALPLEPLRCLIAAFTGRAVGVPVWQSPEH